MNVAVLDLGTNTFNLVIARESSNKQIEIVHSTKLPVKLGAGGINSGFIAADAFKRGIDAIKLHHKAIIKYNVSKALAFGTSALRTAENGPEFLQQIKDSTGIEIILISGDREAELIYYGVSQTYDMKAEKNLILDIGGGSNEFIIADSNQIYWKKSFKLGIARLLEKFSPSDPVTNDEIRKIEAYINTELEELYKQTTVHKPKILLGASGSFETFVSMINVQEVQNQTLSDLVPQSNTISLEAFEILYSKLINSSTLERSKMPGLEPMRVEMIVLAALFVKFIIGKLGIQKIVQSNFSLKEGALHELIKN